MEMKEVKFLEKSNFKMDGRLVFLWLSSGVEVYKNASISKVSNLFGVSKPTAIKIIKDLEDAGAILKIKRRLSGSKESTSNVYVTATLNEDGSLDNSNLISLKEMMLKDKNYIVVDKNILKEEL